MGPATIPTSLSIPRQTDSTADQDLSLLKSNLVRAYGEFIAVQ